jgi:hypothetical protein
MAPRPHSLPPVDTIQAALSYDPATGVIVWRHRPERAARWNARYAGKQAGSVSGNGYLKIALNGRSYLYHRIAWALFAGVSPGDLLVDHVNRDPKDNRAENLRLATASGNQGNRGHNASLALPKGVKFDRARSKFKARVCVNGQRFESKRFDTPEAAHEAYCAMAVKHHGEFARFE